MSLPAGQLEKYRLANLPVPVYRPTRSSGTADRHAYDTQIGTIVHAVLAAVVVEAQSSPRQDWPALVEARAREQLGARRGLGRADRARARVTGLACHYLSAYLPASPAALVGAEIVTAHGIPDLAWTLAGCGSWFDEIKTSPGAGLLTDPDTRLQAERYLASGRDLFGESFLGVRVLPLGNHQAAAFLSSEGTTAPLALAPLPSDTNLGGES